MLDQVTLLLNTFDDCPIALRIKSRLLSVAGCWSSSFVLSHCHPSQQHFSYPESSVVSRPCPALLCLRTFMPSVLSVRNALLSTLSLPNFFFSFQFQLSRHLLCQTFLFIYSHKCHSIFQLCDCIFIYLLILYLTLLNLSSWAYRSFFLRDITF